MEESSQCKKYVPKFFYLFPIHEFVLLLNGEFILIQNSTLFYQCLIRTKAIDYMHTKHKIVWSVIIKMSKKSSNSQIQFLEEKGYLSKKKLFR